MSDHRTPAAGYPPLPERTGDGAYEPSSLVAYFRQAESRGLMNYQIARHLNVPLHRVIFMMEGGGVEIMRRRGKRR